eukprot:6048318-Amphidinium_carterae.1
MVALLRWAAEVGLLSSARAQHIILYTSGTLHKQYLASPDDQLVPKERSRQASLSRLRQLAPCPFLALFWGVNF